MELIKKGLSLEALKKGLPSENVIENAISEIMENKTELLPIEFIGTGEVSGFKFKQVYSDELAYIYKVSDGHITFEVFKRKTAPICLDFGKRIYSETQFKEIYPKSNSFGFWAWSCKTLDSAMSYVKKIHGSKTKD